MPLILRPFQREDSQAIYEVAKKAWLATYQDIFTEEWIFDFLSRNYNPKYLPSLINFMEQGKTDFQVAEDEGNIIGFSQIGFDGYWLPTKRVFDEIVLLRIYLDPKDIGKGVGSKLLHLSEKWVKDQGLDWYYCFVHRQNNLGIEFYKRKGFHHIPDLDKEEENELYYRKELV